MLQQAACATETSLPSRKSTAVDRRELLALSAIVLILSFLGNQIAADPFVAFASLDSALAVNGLACWAIWRALHRAEMSVPSWREIAFLLTLCAVGTIGPRQSAPVALTALALLTALQRTPDFRAASTIMLAVAAHELWSKVLFAAISPELVSLDVSLVARFAHIFSDTVVQQNNMIQLQPDHAIVVEESCSSFSNISFALLCWISVTKAYRSAWVRTDSLIFLLVIAAQVALNVARMYGMALSREGYVFWHDGDGAQIYALAASSFAVVLSAVGLKVARRT